MTQTDRFFYITGWVLIGGLVLLGIFQSLTGRAPTDLPFPCSFHALTGYYCPGCGGTHAVCALVRGDLLTSIKNHAFVPYTAIGFTVYLTWNTFVACKNKGRADLPVMHFHTAYAYVGIAIILIQCILKNVLIATSR